MLVLSLLGLMALEGMAQSLYSSCSSSEDCGDHQVCDLQGRKECQCLPDYHVSSMECIRAVGRGEPCTEEISCRLADRSLRCTTSPGHSLPSCQCKEDTRLVQHLLHTLTSLVQVERDPVCDRRRSGEGESELQSCRERGGSSTSERLLDLHHPE